MTWDIEQRRRSDSAHVIAHWTAWETIYDVVIVEGEGVRRTSRGAASRAALGPGSKPIQGIFRWDPAQTNNPVAVLQWRDGDGRSKQQTIPLGL